MLWHDSDHHEPISLKKDHWPMVWAGNGLIEAGPASVNALIEPLASAPLFRHQSLCNKPSRTGFLLVIKRLKHLLGDS